MRGWDVRGVVGNAERAASSFVTENEGGFPIGFSKGLPFMITVMISVTALIALGSWNQT